MVMIAASAGWGALIEEGENQRVYPIIGWDDDGENIHALVLNPENGEVLTARTMGPFKVIRMMDPPRDLELGQRTMNQLALLLARAPVGGPGRVIGLG